MMITTKDRLRDAMARAGVSGAQLAAELEATPAAISQWLKGTRQPGREHLKRAAKVLDIDPVWLETGGGKEPQPKLEPERAEYLKATSWCFRPGPSDGGRDYGNANIWSLKWDIDTFVREVLQNVIDAALDPSNGVEVVFRLIHLAGEPLREFLEALRWEGKGQLLEHLRGAISAGEQQQLGRFLREGLEALEKGKELVLLVIEDRLTVGLAGPEQGTGNFAALCRNNLDSQKKAQNAGGSYGLGSGVLWRTSQIATVLFNSNLAEPWVTDPMQQEGRLIGRADLSWHSADDDEFAGPGWFGLREVKGSESRARSLWNNRALIHDLHLKRQTDEPGTSVMVIGFHDPDSDSPTDVQQLAQSLAAATARNFWPALDSGRMTVWVETCEARTQLSYLKVDPRNYHPSFVDMLEKYRKGDTKAQLEAEGDVVVKRLGLSIPRRKVKEVHSAMDHQAIVLIRRDGDHEPDKVSGSVVFFRGREMIVQELNLRNLAAGSIPFRAVVLCGEAAGSAVPDRAAELFLRTAEPPAHDRWVYTPGLKADYAQGGKKAIEQFFDGLRKIVREAVHVQREDLDDGPQSLKELFNMGSDPTTKSPTPRVVVDRSASRVNADGEWDIQGTIRMPDTRSWQVRPALVFHGETGGGRRVEWSRLEALTNCKVKDGVLFVPAGTKQATFRAISSAATHPVSALDAAVELVLQESRRLEGGE